MLLLVLTVVLVALVFEFINGFHDTANSIATVVATKVLSPGQALVLAASANLIGAFWGTAVAKTIASGLVDTGVVDVTLQVILCALLGGIIWNLITWWRGLPSSSSHALIGGLCGAALAAADNDWNALIWSQTVGDWTKNQGLLWKVMLPMVTSPVAGFLLGAAMMVLLWTIIAGLARAGGALARLARPLWVNAFFGKAQLASAAYMGLAHGRNDAQKTMGIIALALVGAQGSGALDGLPTWASFLRPDGGKDDIDIWIIVTCAVVMAAGTATGGWRIVKTSRSQDGALASDSGFRCRDQLGDHSHHCRSLWHAGIDDPQHIDGYHGCRFCQVFAGTEMDRDRAHHLGVAFDLPGGGRPCLWSAMASRAGRLGLITSPQLPP